MNKIYLLVFSSFLIVWLFGCNNTTDPKNVQQVETVTNLENTDPLPSWNEGASKKAIINFVTKIVKEGSADFIPVADRVACFDNDGTLWSEQPLYFQFMFALDRVKDLAPHHPEWKTREPFSSVLKGDTRSALAGGEKALIQMIVATQTGMSSAEFDIQVKNWISSAKHPTHHLHYNEMTYKPMVELLAYLRANGFKTYIVSGGDEAFMRVWAEQAYGIPPEQVIGTTMKIVYEVKNDTARLVRIPALNFMDDGSGKPVGINDHIGKRPVFTAGNSDGDYEMLQWTSTATGYPRFGMLVHHTDSLREWAYDRQSHIGHLERGLDDAAKYGWIIVDMKNDWKEVFKNKE